MSFTVGWWKNSCSPIACMVSRGVKKVIERPVVHKDYDEQPRGPFIVCVDTSGSMGGFNEQCAKAFCLALMRIALAENRRCYIMLFSTEIVRYELSGPQGIEQAIRF